MMHYNTKKYLVTLLLSLCTFFTISPMVYFGPSDEIFIDETLFDTKNIHKTNSFDIFKEKLNSYITNPSDENLLILENYTQYVIKNNLLSYRKIMFYLHPDRTKDKNLINLGTNINPNTTRSSCNATEFRVETELEKCATKLEKCRKSINKNENFHTINLLEITTQAHQEYSHYQIGQLVDATYNAVLRRLFPDYIHYKRNRPLKANLDNIQKNQSINKHNIEVLTENKKYLQKETKKINEANAKKINLLINKGSQCFQ